MKVGDIVKTTKDIRFGSRYLLEKGTEMEIVEYNNDGIYKCKKHPKDEYGTVYCLLTSQISK